MSKKRNLGFIGIGVGISILAFFLFFLYIIIEDGSNPYLTIGENAMSSIMKDGEVIKYDRMFSYNSVNEGDVIVFFSDKFSRAVAQRVVEIVQEDPRQIITHGEYSDGSILTNFSVVEEKFMGKVIQIYPNMESAIDDVGGRYP